MPLKYLVKPVAQSALLNAILEVILPAVKTSIHAHPQDDQLSELKRRLAGYELFDIFDRRWVGPRSTV